MKAPRPSARCRALVVELSRYLDDELAPARRRAIVTHIERCACCRGMVADLRRTIALCRAGRKQRLPRAVRERAVHRIRQLTHARRRSR